MSKTRDLKEAEQAIIDRRSSLEAAIKANDVEWGRIYMGWEDPRQRPSTEQVTDLFYKYINDMKPDMADFLLEHGADPEKQHTFQLPDRREVAGLARILINNGGDELFKHLFDRDIITLSHRSVGGDGLLAQALVMENLPLADWLHARGAHVDEANFLGFTALHQCANRVLFQSVEWLLDHGANPELTTLENDSVPAQLIPTLDETGDNDLLFDILEDYSEAYAGGVPAVPAALREKCTQLRQRAKEDEAEEATPPVPGRKARP